MGGQIKNQGHALCYIDLELGQGYLFSKPVPPETIETMLTCQI